MVLVELPKEIERARLEKELSKAKAADELGVSRLTYSMWEKGAWVPQPDKTQALANFTGLPKEEIVGAIMRSMGVLDDNAYYETRYQVD